MDFESLDWISAEEHVGECLMLARERLDGMFGEGYAKAHPELLAAYLESILNVAMVSKSSDPL